VIQKIREKLDVHPVYKRIDTCAAKSFLCEFARCDFDYVAAISLGIIGPHRGTQFALVLRAAQCKSVKDRGGVIR